MAVFKNPNDPRQPKAGVYGWFFQYQHKTHCLYIGQAGLPASPTERCTLFRGISQLARATFCSDGKGKRLDTAFVVGCAIRYVGDELRLIVIGSTLRTIRQRSWHFAGGYAL
jgi:hypothetical protein